MRDVGITDGARLRVTMHPSDPEVYAGVCCSIEGK